MTEKETPDAVSPENAANLLKLEEELKRSRDHWGVTYQILKRIREGEFWRNGGFQNYTLWLAEAAKKSGMHASELWKRFGASTLSVVWGALHDVFEVSSHEHEDLSLHSVSVLQVKSCVAS